MIDQLMRLGMAIVVIALISLGLYQFGGNASTVGPNMHGLTYRP